ncbi:MAPEG family protein [Sphingoaurantiacus capsulatus]|uniref:MAPEG family protein n=1 Tax=Sphingoaurantiacus capsulatus TaxID=1771310 RepID=A0ABV7XB35_9SPHN
MNLSPNDISVLHAVLGMAVLSLVMFIWMYAKRIPAMNAAKVDPQAAMHPGSLNSLPSDARRVADNYNHLWEAPTLFYAMAFYIVVIGHADQLHVWCAWAYLGLRVLHSLVQATFNKVALRFLLFTLSWVALGVMIVRELLAAL